MRGAGDLSGCTVVEIGPGPGGLTRALLESDAAHVIAVEYDPRAVGALQGLVAAADGRLTVVQGDALGMDVCALAAKVPSPSLAGEGGCRAERWQTGEGTWTVTEPTAPHPPVSRRPLSLRRRGEISVVANLPYNIATPLLIGWLKQIHQFRSLTLMFQREVAERIVAPPGGDAYGRLAVMVGWLASAKLLFDIPPQAFTPPPKVTSSVVHIVPREELLAVPFAIMEEVVATAFGQRRKMLRSALKRLGCDASALLTACGIDPERRAETLSIAEFVKLAEAYEVMQRNALQTIHPR